MKLAGALPVPGQGHVADQILRLSVSRQNRAFTGTLFVGGRFIPILYKS